MKERIEEIMRKAGVTPSVFAKHIGIKQAALSHILTGRNNPSLDVVMKINQSYPKVNLDWLLYGKGDMGSVECGGMPDDMPNEIFPMASFHQLSNSDAEVLPNEEANDAQISETIRYIERPPRKIIEIRIFYDDGTYETLTPSR